MRKITKLLLEKVKDKFYELLKDYDEGVFERHNLKCYKANEYCWKNNIGDDYFWRFCDWEYGNFISDLKENFGDYFDFWKEIRQIGTTSSFYLGYYTDERYDSNIDELLDECIKDYGDFRVVYSYAYDYKYNTYTDIVAENNRPYNQKIDERIIRRDMKNLLNGDLKKLMDGCLKQQVEMWNILKAYKDNEVDDFKYFYEQEKEFESCVEKELVEQEQYA